MILFLSKSITRKRLSHVLASLFILVSHCSFSQNNPKAIKLYQEGKNFLSKQKSEQAIKSFEMALALDPSYRDAYLDLYQIYTNQGHTQKAISTLEKASRNVIIGKPSILFSLAQLEINNGLYQGAAKHFAEYLALQTKDSLTRKKADLMLSKANYAMEHLKDSTKIEFVPLNNLINTSAPEYLPSLDASARTLVFTRRTNNQEDLFISRFSQGSWSAPESWPKNSNKNEGAHVISADGKTIVFTGCGWEDSYGGCDLYISEYKMGKWTNPKNLGPAINSRSWESQPSLSANGRILYFVSDRPGGIGGHDIWKSNKQTSTWSRPINLGKNINSPGDEFSPCLHADGVSLYFRSDGFPGYGSQDLFLAQRAINEEWKEAVNLGYPLNDYKDQGAMTVTVDGKTAYFTKQEINSFNQILQSDIVSFILPQSIRANACVYIQGQTTEDVSNQPLVNIPITIAGGADLSRKDTVYSNSEGNYLIVVPAEESYQVHVQMPGYNLYSDRIIATKTFGAIDTLTHKIILQKLILSDTITNKPIILQNVFFDLNSAILLPESYYELDALIVLLQSQTEYSVSIYGHTDDTGGKETNLNLSKQRALTIFNYLLSKGIPGQRLSYQGFGDSRPLADNTTEAGRRQNRRVEFVLSKKTNNNKK